MKSVIKSAIRKLGYDVVRYTPESFPTLDIMPLLIKTLIKDRLQANPDFFFIQVGANDGRMGDPLRESIFTYHVPGILIEPLPDLFSKLRENYKSEPQLRFENVAISTEEGRLPFFRVKQDAPVPSWFQGTGSFDRAQLVAENVDEQFIEEVFVETVTFRSLLDKHAIDKVNLLQVDVQGHDYKVVKSMLDLGIRPDIINYENCLLDGLTRFECKRMLQRHDYSFVDIGIDTLAVQGASQD